VVFGGSSFGGSGSLKVPKACIVAVDIFVQESGVKDRVHAQWRGVVNI
jgi:hypothetical protein